MKIRFDLQFDTATNDCYAISKLRQEVLFLKDFFNDLSENIAEIKTEENEREESKGS